MNEDINSFEKAETRFVIQTTDERELKLYLNARRMACALYDILEWKHAIYNGKDYGSRTYIYKGKELTEQEYFKLNIPDEDRDEHGYVKEGVLKSYYTESEILRRIDDATDKVSDFIWDYFN